MFAVVGTRTAPATAPQTPPQVWDALAERLYATALIQTPSPAFVSELKDALRTAPFMTQQRWVEVLRRRMVDDRVKRTCVDCGCESTLNLTINPDYRATCQVCKAVTEPPLDMIANQQLVAVERQQLRGIPQGADCQTMLEDSFARLCDVSTSVIVIDRYAISDALRAHWNAPQTAGLQRFLQMADARGVGVVDIHIAEGFVLRGRAYEGRRVIAAARRIVSPLNLRNLSLRLIIQSKDAGARKMHDRAVAFAWGAAGGVSFSLGKGFSQFDGRCAQQDYDLGRKEHETVIRRAADLAGSAILSETV